ncbi:uncharacterized protein LOC130935933 isoform X1 [Arachis stenosperma]|uniref:uncharacterized protein LOC130935933 isoform X1 n=1 Tax=Arachis stenosperma TaxID=217475 RepID=UPI0025AD386E|nr:uncharacterized protein LOC130935933 isoform X1 [Arachis stenosperma]
MQRSVTRGRGKGKKDTVIVEPEDPRNGEEEKLPAFRRRGRPIKPLMDDVEEVEATENIEKDEEIVIGNENGSTKDLKTQVITVNKRKRKRSVQTKEKKDLAKEENGNQVKPNPDDSVKPAGFRHNGSRRKNKPCRAAEAGVDCK